MPAQAWKDSSSTHLNKLCSCKFYLVFIQEKKNYLRLSIFMKKRNKAENCRNEEQFSLLAGFLLRGFYAWKEVRWQRRVSVCKPLVFWSLLFSKLVSRSFFFFEDEGGKQSQQVAKETSDLKEKISLIVTNGKRLMLLPFRLFNFFQAGGVKEGWPTGIWRSFPGSKRAILLKCFSYNQFNFCTYFFHCKTKDAI